MSCLVGTWWAKKVAEEVEELGDRQAREQGDALELDADPLLDRVGVPGDVHARGRSASPSIGLSQPFEDLDRRRLAGAVRARACRRPRPWPTSKLTPSTALTSP